MVKKKLNNPVQFLLDHFPDRPQGMVVKSSEPFARIFQDFPHKQWKRQGSWIEFWSHSQRVAFSPHLTYASLYFQGPNPVEIYREIGGQCRTGKVTINVDYGQEFDPEPIRFVVSKAMGF